MDDKIADLIREYEDKRATAEAELAKAGYVKAADGQWRTASKAGVLGWGRSVSTGLEPGAFLTAVYDSHGNDYERQIAAKAVLSDLRSTWIEPESQGLLKSTTGLTDATGGWILPNALVADIVKPAPSPAGLVDLVTRKGGYAGATAIDIPWRGAAPNRAIIAPWGSLKENVDLAYNGYTATLYTLARIYDISKQLVRKSAGAAERDVMAELREAFRLGESYYLWNGTGSSMPLGLIQAFTGAPATFTTAFSPAATLAGSVITAIAKALGDLATRGRTTGNVAVMNPAAYTNLVTQGADTAGFYIAGTQGAANIPGFQAGVPVVYGVPCVADPNCPEDDLYVGDFSAVDLYVGDGFRIDTSDVAGTRWDYNLVGFRGEEEIGFDLRPAVYAGAIQFVADIKP